MKEFSASILKPSRYLGGEINSVKKDLTKVRLRFALVFPDIYEIGMSHFGFQILYHLLNARPEVACERVFAPWVDMESYLRKTQTSLKSLESGIPLSEFDIIGFSLQTELSYTNVLNILSLGGIPLFASERASAHPLVIAGGPCSFNPEPLASFLDAIVVGDGEDAAGEICNVFMEWKEQEGSKDELLDGLAYLPGVYVPSFFDISSYPDGTIKRIVPNRPGYSGVKKRTLTGLDQAPYPTSQIVPFTKIIHDRIILEITRGCTHGCRFCQSGMTTRPVRDRSPDTIVRLADQLVKKTGYEEISLLSLSAGDYPRLGNLISQLITRYAQQAVSISLPSLRMETLSPEIAAEIKRIRKTGFTLAPEAGSMRLRRLINKVIQDEEIEKTIDHVIDAGWHTLKLYFMIGLPTEKEEDLETIVSLVRKLRQRANKKGRPFNLNISLSTFIPKPHTPFQWCSQINPEQTRERINFLKGALSSKHVSVKWQVPEMSCLEGILARGGRYLSQTLALAHERGIHFDGWSEQFQWQKWQDIFSELQIDTQRLLNPLDRDQVLPWEHISSGVSREFLIQEYNRAFDEEETPDCRDAPCNECGVCDFQTIKNETAGSETLLLSATPGVSFHKTANHGPPCRIRAQFTKKGNASRLSHLEMVSIFSRAIRRAELPIKYSKGFHPLPKIRFGPALSVGIESESEFLDLELDARLPARVVVSRLNGVLPEGIRIVEAMEIPLQLQALFVSIKKVEYQVVINHLADSSFSLDSLTKKIQEVLNRTTLSVRRRTKSRTKTIEARPLITHMEYKSPDRLIMQFKQQEEIILKPAEVLEQVLELPSEIIQSARIIKTGVTF